MGHLRWADLHSPDACGDGAALTARGATWAFIVTFPARTHALALSLECGEPSVLLPCQHIRQKPEFGLDFSGVGNSIRNCLAKEFAVSLAKPENGHLERSFRRLHFQSQRGIRRIGVSWKKHFQAFKMLRAAGLHNLVPQHPHDAVKPRERPTSLENPLW